MNTKIGSGICLVQNLHAGLNSCIIRKMTIKPNIHSAKISKSAGVEMTNVGLIMIDDKNIENEKMGEHLL